jgi:DNA-directed RNA polymerase beta' subunit
MPLLLLRHLEIFYANGHPSSGGIFEAQILDPVSHLGCTSGAILGERPGNQLFELFLVDDPISKGHAF